ncbi:transposable element Tcb1 transposase [Trichonephila clavipes]|nr:transposable element Tcb1 transposase [Trichonephila clavipes]
MTDLSEFEKGMIVGMRTPKEAFAPECIVPTVKHEVGPLWYGGAISWHSLGPLVTLHGKVKAAHYVNILGDQVHPFVQTSFPEECPLYQDDNAPIHTAKIGQEWFAEHEGEVGNLDWPPQSPDLNIIEHLWGYLESKLRARFPPPSTISALETALHEEWLHIPLQVVHDLYASIPPIGVSSRPKLTGIVRGKAFLHVLRRRPIGCPDSRKRTPIMPDVMDMIESDID